MRVKRDRAQEAIVRFVADELPSPEAIAVARRAYQEVMREELEVRDAEIQIPDTVRMEEAKIREMLKAGALSVDVAHAALEALAARQRRMAARDKTRRPQ